MTDFTDADEAAPKKRAALNTLFFIAATGETLGVLAQYEQAALDQGATPIETARVIREGQHMGHHLRALPSHWFNRLQQSPEDTP